jgi:hypothetical protein
LSLAKRAIVTFNVLTDVTEEVSAAEVVIEGEALNHNGEGLLGIMEPKEVTLSKLVTH